MFLSNKHIVAGQEEEKWVGNGTNTTKNSFYKQSMLYRWLFKRVDYVMMTMM
jgi:hypothetical protein